ncbi:MAG: carboxylating nicotinate-nucleotide diphosphorylase [Bacillaceae bacterium]|nr:carboxylating nicotinate-nucleotide diphosphorylase [Bacillaceae bacterium]
MNEQLVRKQLCLFFEEDIGFGDITSSSIFNKDDIGSGTFLIKADGIFCGKEVIREGFKFINEKIDVHVTVNDGDPVKEGDIIAKVTGPVLDLLAAERVILNLVQRMSGIATVTRQAVSVLNNPKTKICDTRKTTPGLRMFEKYAVRCGGGMNHRMGLFDAVMIKDNHIAASGGIKNAVNLVKQNVGHTVKVEVETETIEDVLEAVQAKADIIMFDNRTPEEIIEWINVIPKHVITEASGGITLQNLSDYGTTNVDCISLGFLTHSVKSLDISFNIENKK